MKDITEALMYAAYTASGVMTAFSTILFFRLRIRKTVGVLRYMRNSEKTAGKRAWRVTRRVLIVHENEGDEPERRGKYT